MIWYDIMIYDTDIILWFYDTDIGHVLIFVLCCLAWGCSAGAGCAGRCVSWKREGAKPGREVGPSCIPCKPPTMVEPPAPTGLVFSVKKMKELAAYLIKKSNPSNRKELEVWFFDKDFFLTQASPKKPTGGSKWCVAVTQNGPECVSLSKFKAVQAKLNATINTGQITSATHQCRASLPHITLTSKNNFSWRVLRPPKVYVESKIDWNFLMMSRV